MIHLNIFIIFMDILKLLDNQIYFCNIINLHI